MMADAQPEVVPNSAVDSVAGWEDAARAAEVCPVPVEVVSPVPVAEVFRAPVAEVYPDSALAVDHHLGAVHHPAVVPAAEQAEWSPEVRPHPVPVFFEAAHFEQMQEVSRPMKQSPQRAKSESLGPLWNPPTGLSPNAVRLGDTTFKRKLIDFTPGTTQLPSHFRRKMF
jgi:hypothetical protein